MTDFDRFAEPLDGESPCGPDCEYENDFIALAQAVVGKPEQQFGDTVIPAVPPDWPEVDNLSRALLQRTRDLRVVGWLALANTQMRGAPAFAAGLRLMLQLCERFWDEVHPRVVVDGDDDPYLRMNAISAFAGSEFSGEDRLIQALRGSTLIKQPLVLTYRDAELTFSKAPEAKYDLPQVESMILDAIAAGNESVLAVVEALENYEKLQTLLDEKVASGDAPDMERLPQILKPVALGIRHLQATATGGVSDAEADVTSGDIAVGGAPVSAPGVVNSREDARRALERVCEYLERHEPSNPAALFARRAQRMLDMSFLDIMRELSPDSMSHLEMLTGAPRQDQSY
ncbi:MAG: type VI secretion system protein TssA [Burkholderiales bacterium]|nr:type VI secretion system protein TssA [Burkholderiales bacterium]